MKRDLLDRFAGFCGALPFRTQAYRLAHERALTDGRGKGIDGIDMAAGMLGGNIPCGLRGDIRRGRKPARKGDVDDLARAVRDQPFKVRAMRVVREHGRARKAARTQAAVKIDVLLVFGKIVDPLAQRAVSSIVKESGTMRISCSRT